MANRSPRLFVHISTDIATYLFELLLNQTAMQHIQFGIWKLNDELKGMYGILYKAEEAMPQSKKSAKRKAADKKKAAKKK